MNRRAQRYQAKKTEQEDEIEDVNNDQLAFSSPHCLEPSRILQLFTACFKSILESPNLQQHIQVVKERLYHRDYLAAFDSDDKRFAYASRWSPARSLAYASLFSSMALVRELFEDPNRSTKAVCVGGGALSELLALAALFARFKEHNSTSLSNLEVTLVDIADWSTVISNLEAHIKSNWVYIPECFRTVFLHKDVLGLTIDYSDKDLITLLFTTNELFCEKRAETVKFLQTLNASCKAGTLLLIAESAGSYSHITVGSKRFPVQFLIDTILVGKPNSDNGAWEIVQLSESCWYRVNQREVNYDMKLENMRFFYRLYRKC